MKIASIVLIWLMLGISAEARIVCDWETATCWRVYGGHEGYRPDWWRWRGGVDHWREREYDHREHWNERRD